ncbi:hypothetical protein Scep_022098 [Stephania cephalantha]|uniref:Uncharacterized protein n=1 Tax=Stephania cephalantha TaxID=152367 RepID=A0AAP0I2D7_9MAGN
MTDDYMWWFTGISHRIVENTQRINPTTKDEADIYDRVWRHVDVMTAWKALSPGEVANIAAV